MDNQYIDMMQNFLVQLGQWICDHLKLEGFEEKNLEFVPTQNATHGDFTTSAAFALAKKYHRAPEEIAERICHYAQKLEGIASACVAHRGFANITVEKNLWQAWAKEALSQGLQYGIHPFNNTTVNIEYVSANPTGPLHVGHGRCAIMGDVLASLLEAAGYAVTREYYVNDAGNQIHLLARSVYKSYMACLGHPWEDSESYPGEYINEIGQEIAQQEGQRWVEASQDVWMPYFGMYAIRCILMIIRSNLEALGIQHDVFTCERFLHEHGVVQRMFQALCDQDLVYQGVLEAPKVDRVEHILSRAPLSLLKTTTWGDTQDRALSKTDGTWTYFAADIAYHLDKLRRKFDVCIDIWGADHIGHVTRLKGAIQALTGKDNIEIICCQMVRFFDCGEPIKMSKRSGNFITIQDILQYIDAETFRFFMINKKADTHFDLDIEVMKACTKDNPIFYIQYAHARCCSVLRHAKEMFPHIDFSALWTGDLDLSCWNASYQDGVKWVCDFPRLILHAAQTREPHLICAWLYKLAQLFHGVWQKGSHDAELRFLQSQDQESSLAHVVWVQLLALALKRGLAILGIRAKEEL